MSKYFFATTRQVKAREFLELKQGTMTMMEYVAKFTELARFTMRKFEDGLKLSIRGKIVGFLIQGMESIVRTAMAIEREIEDARSIRDVDAGDKRKKSQPSSSSGKNSKASSSQGFRDGATTIKAKARPGFLPSQDRYMFPLPST